MMNWFHSIVRRLQGADSRKLLVAPAPTLTPERLGALMQGILSTNDEELDCDECFVQLDRFVELHLAGKNAAEALPLVQEHLRRCRDCREEFEALTKALEAIV